MDLDAYGPKNLNPIGYRKNGQPIYLVAGGDERATPDHTRRAELLSILANPPEGTDLDAIATEAEEVSTRIAASNAAAARAVAARQRLLGAEPTPGAGAGAVSTQERQGEGGGGQTRDREATVRVRPGQAFTESESFAQFRSRGATGTAQIVLGGGLRALIDNSATSGGSFQNPEREPDLIATNEDRVPRIADLVDMRTTDSNTVEYVQDTTVAPQGTAAEVAEGALKPESTYTFTVVSEPVRTIAHWVNLTRQSVDDNSMLQGYVEGRLAYGLDHRLDSQVLNGSGASPNLRGILNASGLGVYAAPAGEAALISIRRAITVAQGSEFSPDAVVMNPVDWERVELSQDTQGMFRVSPNVANSLTPRIWGLTVVASTVILGTVGGATPAGGRFLVGAFRIGATLWMRQGTTLLMTDSHASNFTSNVLTMLAERRGALAIWRPRAFVAGTFSTGTA